MKRTRKILLYSLLGLFLIVFLYWTHLLPLGIVPVYDGNSMRVAGFLTCERLNDHPWAFAHVSGEYLSRESFFGVKYPYIYFSDFHANCPNFIAPEK